MRLFHPRCALLAALLGACSACERTEPRPVPVASTPVPPPAAAVPVPLPAPQPAPAPVALPRAPVAAPATEPVPEFVLTDADWKAKLTLAQYEILRKRGTEPAFSGAYDKTFEAGVYHCAGCGAVVFRSADKFNSGCGWPAFSNAAGESAVVQVEDTSRGLKKLEIRCAKCGGHLGHLFDDGPAPGKKRYCINSGALEFEKAK